jgi:hypothetical protein
MPAKNDKRESRDSFFMQYENHLLCTLISAVSRSCCCCCCCGEKFIIITEMAYAQDGSFSSIVLCLSRAIIIILRSPPTHPTCLRRRSNSHMANDEKAQESSDMPWHYLIYGPKRLNHIHIFVAAVAFTPKWDVWREEGILIAMHCILMNTRRISGSSNPQNILGLATMLHSQADKNTKLMNTSWPSYLRVFSLLLSLARSSTCSLVRTVAHRKSIREQFKLPLSPIRRR